MHIDTKYNIGDELWTIDHDEVVGFTVENITFNHRTLETDYFDGFPTKSVQEILYSGEGVEPHNEDKCFKTKEELINSLK